MKLVQFENGKYGVRTVWFFGWRFVDLESPNFQWCPGDRFFKCCMGERADAEKALTYATGAHKVVK